jgi:peroxiredoxin
MTFEIGKKAPTFMAETLSGETIYLKDFINRPVLIKFYRFAECPVCNLHLREFIRKYDELEKEGLSVIIIYHSPKWRFEKSGKENLPFPIIPDPEKKIFGKYGVKNSWAGMFSFTVWRDYAVAMAAGFSSGMFAHDGGITGHPADFLVDKEGVLRFVHYGADYADSLTVEQAITAAKKMNLIEGGQPHNAGLGNFRVPSFQ